MKKNANKCPKKIENLRLNDVRQKRESMFVNRRNRPINRECAIRRRLECSEKLNLGWQFSIERKREFELVGLGLKIIIDMI